MGVLEIRQRSVGLQNLGRVRSPTLDNGALSAAQTLASASANLGASHRRIGDALAGVGSAALKVALVMQERADQNAADAFCNEYQSRLNAYNDGGADDGHGGRTQGVMAQTVGDTRQWLKDNERERARIDAAAREKSGVDDRQYAIARRRLFGYDEGVLSRWRKKAAETDRAREVANANGRFAMAKVAALNLAKGLSAPDDAKAAEQIWREYGDALEHKMDVNGVLGEDQRKAERMAEAYSICEASVAQFAIATSERATLAGADGDKVFDERIESLKKTDATSFLPPSSWITDDGGRRCNRLLDALRDTDMAAFRDAAIRKMKKARGDWASAMRRNTVDGFANAQNDILAIPAPEDGDELGQKNYQREVAAAYRRLIAKDPRVLSGRGDEWVRDDLKRFAPEKVAVALRAIRGADDRADRARVRSNGQIFLRSFTVGVPDPMVAGGRRQLTTAEKNNLTEFLYTNGEISHEVYALAKKQVAAETTPLAKKFLSMISEGMNGKFPKVCAWQDKLMAYAFSDTKEAKELAKSKTGIKTTYQNETNEEMTERLLFNEYADFASLVMEKMVATGAKPGESDGDMLLRAKDEFDKLTRGTNDGIYRLSVKRRQEAYRQNVDALVNTNRSRINVASGLPAGMELSQKTQSAQGGTSSGGQKKRKEKE